jgi:hypothetical protein
MKRIGASVAVGFVGWLVLWLVPLPGHEGVALIEKLFLLAPLVIVPLALRVAAELRGRPVWLGGLQPLTAWLAVGSFFVPTGSVAAVVMASAWMAMTLVLGVNGLGDLRRGAWRRPDSLALAMALVMIPAGGLGLVLSRWGLTPFGIKEPLILLTGVHFHYAAFVSPLMAALAIAGSNRRMDWFMVGCTLAGSPLLAVGFIGSLPLVRVAGAMLLVTGLAGVSLATLVAVTRMTSLVARGLVMPAAMCLALGLMYATVYAMSDWFGANWIPIPHMARTHGMLNALGFALCGLAGWTWELAAEPAEEKKALHTLTRLWGV